MTNNLFCRVLLLVTDSIVGTAFQLSVSLCFTGHLPTLFSKTQCTFKTGVSKASCINSAYAQKACILHFPRKTPDVSKLK